MVEGGGKRYLISVHTNLKVAGVPNHRIWISLGFLPKSQFCCQIREKMLPTQFRQDLPSTSTPESWKILHKVLQKIGTRFEHPYFPQKRLIHFHFHVVHFKYFTSRKFRQESIILPSTAIECIKCDEFPSSIFIRQF